MYFTYRDYCILFNDKNSQNAEPNLISMQTVKKQVQLQNSYM